MSLLYVLIAVLILLLLMVVLKINAFISLIVVALIAGVMQGMSPLEAITSIKSGMGSTLGSLALVLGFGAMLGKLMENSGAAQTIAMTLIAKFGRKHVQWAAVMTGFIVGIALFYETGFVILIPLVFTIAKAAKLPVLYIGMPVAAALITAHGFVPPHPGPTAIAQIFNANLGLTLLYGIVIAIPSVIISGVYYPRLFKKESLETNIPKELFSAKEFDDDELPSFGISLFTALIPVLLMGLHAGFEIFAPESSLMPFLVFIGEPSIALLVAVIVAIFTFGLMQKFSMKEIMNSIASSVSSIAMILLIIGAGGAFKQVLVDSGVADYVSEIVKDMSFSPLLLAWLIAALLRLALGSATVAGMTAAGIMVPVLAGAGVNAELLVLAIGAGSMTFSHVNDAGFWIYKEYFNLSVGKTIKTWSMMTLISSLIGLGGVMLLNMFV